MSGTTIITIVAVAVILVVFGIPLYVVRRRNRIQIEDGETEPEQVSTTMEVTPVNDSEPKLTQEPSLTAGPFAVDMTPVPPVKPATRPRTEKKATVAPAAEKKATRTRKPKTDISEKQVKKALKQVAELAKTKNATKGSKTTKTTKTVKKSAPKTKKIK